MPRTPDRAFIIENFRGLDLLLEIGISDSGERLLRMRVRQTGNLQWQNLIEMLMEFTNYWSDQQVAFTEDRRNPPTRL